MTRNEWWIWGWRLEWRKALRRQWWEGDLNGPVTEWMVKPAKGAGDLKVEGKEGEEDRFYNGTAWRETWKEWERNGDHGKIWRELETVDRECSEKNMWRKRWRQNKTNLGIHDLWWEGFQEENNNEAFHFRDFTTVTRLTLFNKTPPGGDTALRSHITHRLHLNSKRVLTWNGNSIISINSCLLSILM